MKRSGILMVENVKELIKAHEGIKHEVYLDNENSTIVPNEIIEKMLPYYNKRAYGNPTLTHKPGWEAFETIMESAQKIAEFIGAKILEEITFTPGAPRRSGCEAAHLRTARGGGGGADIR